MNAAGSHLARQMRPHLGTELWDEFLQETANGSLKKLNVPGDLGLAAVCARLGRLRSCET